MSVYIEALKQMNLVDFLAEHYGLKFSPSGSGYVASSPFGANGNPSFFVRQLEGRWLFKDFSSGLGGSIIDLVGHLESLSGVGNILRRIAQLVGGKATGMSVAFAEAAGDDKPGYDIEQLYQRFRGKDPGVCRRYLVGRGIDAELVEELISAGEVVHNHHQGKSYCCFAVRDGSGELKCLDNHEIDGSGKFVLGAKSVYSRDWEALASATEAFISEGIVDYLSIKTLEGGALVGIALLGNQLIFDESLLAGCQRIITACDEDRGGMSAFVDLMERYPDKELETYPLEGHKDPNELLQSGGRKKGKRLSAEEKLELYRAFQCSENKSELARKWAIDRSHMYEIIHDIDRLVIGGLTSRQPGRRASGQPETIKDAFDQIGRLQNQNRQLGLERDKSFCREEFLRLRLKWSEIETAKLRGEPVDDKSGPVKKAQIKEKKETVAMIDSLKSRFDHLALLDIYATCSHSRSQLHKWRQAASLERKVREQKDLDESVIENASRVIATFPHFGGVKGQGFMLYHGLGLIGQKAYDGIKKKVKRVLCQEVSQRKDLPPGADKFEHIRPERIGQIWAEDFTQIVIDGTGFKLALLIDVFSQDILGWALARRATESLVAIPVQQALAANADEPPAMFLLRDNGKQYISEKHDRLLDAHEIVGRHVPPYTPQYNGAVECGGKEFKNVFYNVWERRKTNGTDKEKTIDERAHLAAAESVHLLNDEIPRPALGGVTPADVHSGRKAQRQKEIKQYRQEQEARGTPPPLSRPFWDVIKGGVRAEVMSSKELLTKIAFFGMRPLRRVAQLNREVWGS